MPPDVETRTRPTGAAATAPVTPRGPAEVAVPEPGPAVRWIYDKASINALPPLHSTLIHRPASFRPPEDKDKQVEHWTHVVMFLVGAAVGSALFAVLCAIWAVCHLLLFFVGTWKRAVVGAVLAPTVWFVLTHYVH